MTAKSQAKILAARQATLWQTPWIMLRSGMSTFNICLRSIVLKCFHKATKDRIDALLRGWSHTLLNILKANINIHGLEKIKDLPKTSLIVMCNHTSLYDIPLTYIVLPEHSIRMLAKKELFRIPIFGQAMKASTFPSIDRNNRQQAKKDLGYTKHLLENGYVIWIAPEGTRSKTGEILPFKKGGFLLAIDCKAKILPIYIKGANHLLPAKTWQFKLHQDIDIYIGDVIDTENCRYRDRDKLIEQVNAQWQQANKQH